MFSEVVERFGNDRSPESIAKDLTAILRTVVGRQFSPGSVRAAGASSIFNRFGWRALRALARRDAPSDRMDLEGFFRSGLPQAARIRPFIAPSYVVLEYGGGIGRIGRHLSGDCRRVVSVDVNPLMRVYGSVLCPDIEFRLLEEIPAEATFDGCYSVAVFFHLDDEEHRRALEYIWERLKPGGRALVDIRLGAKASPCSPVTNTRTAAEGPFLALCNEYFDTKRIHLFNDAVVLTKRG